MKSTILAPVLFALLTPAASMAQDLGQSEVIVTAARRESSDYSAQMPAVGLRRTADFAVQQVTVTGDTRDPEKREAEIFAMIKGAIATAQRSGVELAYGEEVLQPLTLATYRNLTLKKDNRPDTSKVSFLVKAPLKAGGGAQDAQARITAFVKTAAPVGRALIEQSEDLTLSVVAPDQYRAAIADAIAADAKAMAAKLGDGYAVEIEGLNRPVEWARSGLTEVFLFVPYRLTITPRR